MVQLSPEMNSELRKAVTSFNRKIKRLQKKGVNMTRPQNIVGQAMYLPAFIAGVSPFT